MFVPRMTPLVKIENISVAKVWIARDVIYLVQGIKKSGGCIFQ
jgi:hypothetical protein